LLLVQDILAPTPAGAPSIEYFVAGSILAHGDHSLKRERSLTIPNTSSGAAAITVERSTCTFCGVT
jgi:hypothetical protein